MQKAYRILFTSVFIFVFCSCLYSQDILDEKITLNIQNQSIENILTVIQKNTGITFSYSKSIIDLSSITSITCNYVSLETVLTQIFENKDIIYSVVSGVVVLRKKPQNIDNLKVKGKIYDSNNNKPLEFAGLQLINTTIGTITNVDGEFNLIIKKTQLTDTLLISALGYERQKIILSEIQKNPDTIIYLKTISILLTEIGVNANDYKLITIGNDKKISFGSLYIDTHGQQTALYIENEDKSKGIILAVNYYLSPKGNTKAPFRVRLYQIDSLGIPGEDILPDVLIAKPKFNGGWFTINLSHYHIPIPENGFFVAIEGIYPVEKESTENFEEDDYPKTISYGQQLGYSKKKGNNTWHFSLIHTWFQMEENNYNVMISVDIQKLKNKKNNE